MTNTTSPTERVGRYQLLEPIGVGPSGAVSRAKVFGVAGFERQFAVKRFHAELTATAAMAAMMSAAARAYGSLEHPRIARMSEFGVAQGSTFTAVELVVGIDALRLIAETRLTGVSLAAGGALALVSQAARAVGYAHGRGLTHLGLAPTNVIVTADGDIKITDFGILSATLPQRPIEVPRLAQRIPYLAPEQLANEATSAATDVFALGVLAYELVTSSRTFKGDTPQQVASAIMAGPPAEPPLPRPIVRVLQRCLARSPFERFPDARALADALDAALRVAPVPGTRKDVGAQVKETLDRLAALNEGQMSGVVALHLGTGPIRRPGEDTRAPSQGGSGPETLRETGETLAYELSRPDAPAGGPLGFGGPATTQPDLPRSPMTTVPGMAPPPIPVPQGIGGPPTTPLAAPPGASTLLGVGKSPPALPSLKSRTGSVVGSLPSKPPAVPTGAGRPPPRPGTDLAIPQEPVAAQPVSTSDSAVHALDTSELVPLDGSPGDAVDFDAIDDQGPQDEGPDAVDDGWKQPSSSGAIQPAPAPASRASGGPPAPGKPTMPARPAAVARSTYRLDPSSVDTRPIAPVVLEPLLFDPIKRRSAPGVPSGLDDDTVTFDDSREPGASSGSATGSETSPATGDDADSRAPGPQVQAPPSPAPQAPPSSASQAPPSSAPLAASSDPRLGKTIVGFASPLPLPRTAAPSQTQTPPPGTNRPPPTQPADEISEIALEDFRAVSAPDRPMPEPWSHEPAEHGRGGELARAAHESGLAATIPPVPLADLPQPGFPSPPAEQSPTPPMPSGWVSAPPLPRESRSATYRAARPRRPLAGIVAGMIGAAIVGVAAWQIYVRVIASPTRGTGSGRHVQIPDNAQVAAVASDAGKLAVATAPPGDAAQIASPPIDATSTAVVTAPPRDAARVATVPPTDAASATIATAPPSDAARVATAPPSDAARVATVPPSDAARVATVPPSDARPAPADATQVAAVSPGVPTTPGDTLSIASTPPGARVFLDGSDTGATPLKLPGTPDRHTIALLLAGHELYVAQVDGHGTFQIPLKEVTPANGPAGIKVLRCKDKDRYYVFIDGKPTGQTCPTERIGCEMGPHTVEVYDVVSETRRKWDIVVKETRLSFRVRVE